MAFNAFSNMREEKQGATAENKKIADKNDLKNIESSTEGTLFRKTIKENKEVKEVKQREASQYAKSEKSFDLKEQTKLKDLPNVSESRNQAFPDNNPSMSENIEKSRQAAIDNHDNKEGKESKSSKFITFIDDAGNEYKVPSNARAKAKIAKEEKEIGLQKLLNQEAGIVDWTKKYSEFDNERKKWVSDAEKTSDFFKQFGAKFAENPSEGMVYLAEKLNLSPVKVKRLLRDSVGKEAQDYYAMEENQRQMFDLREENDYNQKMLQQMNEKQRAHTENEIHEAGMKEVMQVHKINEKKREEIEGWVLGDKGGRLSPDDLIHYSKEYDRLNSLYDIAASIDPKLEHDEDLIAFLDARTVRNPDMTNKEIKNLATRYLGTYEAVKQEREEDESAEVLRSKVPEPIAKAEPRSFNRPVRISDLLGKN